MEKEGRLYNLYRGIQWNPSFVTSTDGGETWGKTQHLIQDELNGTQRPYARYVGNGTDTIGISFTDAHPRDFGNSLYYAEFRNGNFYTANGSYIKNLSKDGPLKPSEAEKIYTGGEGEFRGVDLSAENSAWTSSVAFDDKGYPHIAYSLYLNNQDQRYRIASWNGKQWYDREVAYAGSRLYEREASYTRLITLEASNPSHVLISSDVNPSTGKALEGTHQVFRALIGANDDINSIQWQRLSKDNAHHNIRPMVVNGEDKNAILWLNGEYKTYTDYNLDAVGIVY
ncbi:hypothetical protein CA267_004170 [Alteromonas pelagimontana]|uniref:Exo-alpha-sialidase n=1 Tax=Alteromonas pelagimontana TaxID=1858656 RepID=A0A6M4MA43_9ALTE|nr:BNR-4 repeat-containing protein [Alteromonas pelagimontana]QJR80033.1 hypothetical protein CA267_004170 [Alteromonas pelagimontana]